MKLVFTDEQCKLFRQESLRSEMFADDFGNDLERMFTG